MFFGISGHSHSISTNHGSQRFPSLRSIFPQDFDIVGGSFVVRRTRAKRALMVSDLMEGEDISISSQFFVMLLGHQFFHTAIIIGQEHLNAFVVLSITVHDFLDDLGTHSLAIVHIMKES